MDQRNKQIPRPKHWQEFEELCLVLFSEVWKDRLAKKNGRSGQAQHGVDVWGAVEGNRSRFQGVQCKGKDQALGTAVTRAELLDEIAKADGFSPKLDHWILVTTGPADGEIEKVAREISVERERDGRFTVQVMGWSDLERDCLNFCVRGLEGHARNQSDIRANPSRMLRGRSGKTVAVDDGELVHRCLPFVS